MALLGSLDASLFVDTDDLDRAESRSRAFVQSVSQQYTILDASGRVAAQGQTAFGDAVAASGGKVRGMVPNTNAANNALLDFGRIVEDSAFGLRGIANNITPFILSLGRAKEAAQASGESLGKNLLGALKGPGGFIALMSIATTVALVFGDKIESIFDRGAKKARELREAIGKAVGSLIELEDVGTFEAGIKDLERAVAAARGLVVAQQNTVRQLEASSTTFRTPTGTVTRENVALPGARDLLAVREKTRDALEEQLVAARAQVAAADILKSLSLKRKVDESEIEKLLNRQFRIRQLEARKLEEALQNAGRTFEKLQQRRRDLSGDPFFRETGLEEIPLQFDQIERFIDNLGQRKIRLNFAAFEGLRGRDGAAPDVIPLPKPDELAAVGGAIQQYLIDPGNAFVSTFSAGIADILTGFKKFSDLIDVISQGLRGLIAQLIEAAIRAAVIKGIASILGIATGGFSSLFLGALGFSGAIPATPAPLGGGFSAVGLPASLRVSPSAPIVFQSTVRGQDIVQTGQLTLARQGR